VQFTYLTQFFWLLIFYIGFYVLLCYNGLPKIRSITESSKKCFLQALYSITLAIPFSLLFQELLPIAECASGDETSKTGSSINKWVVPVAIALGGAKVIEKLPPKQRLPAFGITVVAVTVNTGICAGADLMKGIPKYPPAEPGSPGSPRSGPF
jgi:Plant ATP synthase F0